MSTVIFRKRKKSGKLEKFPTGVISLLHTVGKRCVRVLPKFNTKEVKQLSVYSCKCRHTQHTYNYYIRSVKLVAVEKPR